MNMRKITLILLTSILGFSATAQQMTWDEVKNNREGNLTVLYHHNSPFAYLNAKNKLSGIEADILDYFKQWLWETKKINLTINYQKAADFINMYQEVKSSEGNVMGMGTVSITEERASEVQFSSPYLKNISVLITDGSVPTLRTQDDIKASFSGLTPVTIKGSVHEIHAMKIVKMAESSVTPLYVSNPMDIPNKIKESSKYFGYIDIISYWTYVKSSSEYIKMHRIANVEQEKFGFIFPLDSDWTIIFNEFFESGFGFTSTKDYRLILEKHLGYEILNKVEVD